MGYLIQGGTGTVNLNLALAMGNTAPLENLGPVQEVFAESFAGGSNGIGAALDTLLGGNGVIPTIEFSWPSGSDQFRVGIGQMYGYGQFVMDDVTSSIRMVIAGQYRNGNELVWFNTGGNPSVVMHNLYLDTYGGGSSEVGEYLATLGSNFDAYGAAQDVRMSLNTAATDTNISADGSGNLTATDIHIGWEYGVNATMGAAVCSGGSGMFYSTGDSHVYKDNNITSDGNGNITANQINVWGNGVYPIIVTNGAAKVDNEGNATFADITLTDVGRSFSVATAFNGLQNNAGNGTQYMLCGGSGCMYVDTNITTDGSGNLSVNNLVLRGQGGLCWMDTDAGAVWCDANILPNGEGWLKFTGGGSGIEFDDSSNGISLGAASRLNMAAGGQYSYGRLALPDISHQSRVENSLVANTAWATLDETNSNLVFSVLLSDGQTVKHGTVALS